MWHYMDKRYRKIRRSLADYGEQSPSIVRSEPTVLVDLNVFDWYYFSTKIPFKPNWLTFNSVRINGITS